MRGMLIKCVAPEVDKGGRTSLIYLIYSNIYYFFSSTFSIISSKFFLGSFFLIPQVSLLYIDLS